LGTRKVKPACSALADTAFIEATIGTVSMILGRPSG